MKLSITSVSDWRARLGRITSHYDYAIARSARLSYGQEVTSVALLLMCVSDQARLKRRLRFRRERAEFYTDIMLDLSVIIPLPMKDKMRYIFREILEQLSEQLNRKKFRDFDHKRFLRDLKRWFKRIEDRYDGQTSGPWHYASGE
ncbi:MAG: hypothetical protein DI597_07490 [Pseudoxanthomonas spadix]|nr:MAG: hypothetical protein DI597_07490 [Pseudoxanthomonas spadix]